MHYSTVFLGLAMSVSAILPNDWASSVPIPSYAEAIIDGLARAYSVSSAQITVVHLPNRVPGYDVLAAVYVHREELWPVRAVLLVVPSSDVGCQTVWYLAHSLKTYYYMGVTSYDAQKVTKKSEQGHAQFTFKCKVNYRALDQVTSDWGFGGRKELSNMMDQHERMHKEPYQAQCPCKEDTVQITGGKATCTNTTGRTAKDCLKTNFQAPRGSSATFTIATDYNQAGS